MRKVMMVPLIALAAAAASCAGAQGGPAGGGRTLAGVIVGVDLAAAPARVVVEGAPGVSGMPPGGRAVLLVSQETEVSVQRADGTVQRGRAADLAVGLRVEAEHTGTELRSLPPQYDAVRIRVIPSP